MHDNPLRLTSEKQNWETGHSALPQSTAVDARSPSDTARTRKERTHAESARKSRRRAHEQQLARHFERINTGIEVLLSKLNSFDRHGGSGDGQKLQMTSFIGRRKSCLPPASSLPHFPPHRTTRPRPLQSAPDASTERGAEKHASGTKQDRVRSLARSPAATAVLGRCIYYGFVRGRE